jgi:hypothetical protein
VRPFLAAALGLLLAARTAPAAAPKAEFSATERDAGVVSPGEIATADFAFTNGGDAPLTLSAEAPADVRVAVPSAPVPPGGKANLRVEVGTAQRDGPSVVEIGVRTNDPANPLVKLRVVLAVREYVFADPGFARFNFVQGGRYGIVRETIAAIDDAPFAILSVDSPLPALTARFRPASPSERLPERPGAQWIVEVSLSPNAPVGSLGAELVFHLDHPRQKRLVVPVTGFVRPMLAVTPPEADLGDLEARPVSARLLVRSFAEEPVRLLQAACDIPGSTVEIRPIQEGWRWEVVLHLPERAPGDLVTGWLRIETTSGTQPELEIPVRGRFLGRPRA